MKLHMPNKIIDHLLPVAGGAAGAIQQTTSIMQVNLTTCLTTMVYASLGAIAGYIIKLLLDYIVKRIRNRR